MIALSTERSNWVKAERLGSYLKLKIRFEILGEHHYRTDAFYSIKDKAVYVPLDKLISQSPTDCAIIFHEMAHAWQFKYLKYFMVLFAWSYWTRLCLEAHATRLALKWMKKYFNDAEILEAKKELTNALKTYL